MLIRGKLQQRRTKRGCLTEIERLRRELRGQAQCFLVPCSLGKRLQIDQRDSDRSRWSNLLDGTPIDAGIVGTQDFMAPLHFRQTPFKHILLEVPLESKE